jgi:hypothetical protein
MMSSADELIDSVAAIGRHYQLDDFRLNHEQMATFALPDGLTVTIECAAKPPLRAFVIVELTSIRDSDFDEMAMALLDLNCRWLDTGGASFALHPTSDKVLAILPVPAAALNAAILPHVVDRFLARCRTWADKINRSETDLSVRSEIEAGLDAAANA